ncbi:MAG: tRNA (N(6)-L-threonylcarbamoyladenosine(37)-C(2))-methylthiotransferase MtaB [Desulfarculaceae bacterium]|nr:tRNA (N(6)-L-threonylcarbamoyladenosine(37)-C(2))-methylthiotransferase MtaB [Desulfarculaceae bacterium]
MTLFYIHTLGCKVNRYESDGIAAELEKKGARRTDRPDRADVCVINTCTVTSKAGMQSRQEIRRIRKSNPDARLIVTGCYAQTESETVKAISGVDRVVGHEQKFGIADMITGGKFHDAKPGDVNSPVCNDTAYRNFQTPVKGEMTRAYLKIQDGCNAFCSYCIIPYARGRSRSMPERDILEHLKILSDSGYNEVILTGIHIGNWGSDLPSAPTFTDLLETIVRKKPVNRIRISSIEPMEVTDGLIDLIREGHTICDHLHIPLQSGDDMILGRMNRPYGTALFKDLIAKVHHAVPGASIGTDIIAGFPGETDESFERTLSLVQSLPLDYMHVFPFSPRKGTRAYNFTDRVADKTVTDRCARLREISAAKRRAFESGFFGSILNGVVLEKRNPDTGLLKVVTSNYLNISVDTDDSFKGKTVDVQVEKWDSNGNLTGTIQP